jgi:hypothetical protein
MSRTTIRRIARLEAAQPDCTFRSHQLIFDPGEDEDARIAALIASGGAKAGDIFVCRIIVSPPAREVSG